MSDTIINRAYQNIAKGSKTPFADAASSYSDDELCMMSFEAKDFLADCLYEEVIATMRTERWPFAVYFAAGLGVLTIHYFGYHGIALFCSISLIFAMSRTQVNRASSHVADQFRRVIDWIKFDAQAQEATMEAFENLMEREE